ncbi:hypothetical protein B0H13DRAFT_1857420 [Mycena leptocephala]|nr:hypothetical protein B0H13DRAFT_1857420 [Mycena leptocephala]
MSTPPRAWKPSLNPSSPSHSPPSSPPSWSKAGVWVKRESGKHGSNCTIISDFGPHHSTLAALPTLHPALHPRGRKQESGSKERVGSMDPTAPSFRILNIVSIPLEAQCVPLWVDMAGKLPAPLRECPVHPIRGPTWWGNFPLHSVNVMSIPLEAQCVPRWVDMAGKLPAPLSEYRVHPIRGPRPSVRLNGWTWRGQFSLYPVNAVSIPLEFQSAGRHALSSTPSLGTLQERTGCKETQPRSYHHGTVIVRATESAPPFQVQYAREPDISSDRGCDKEIRRGEGQECSRPRREVTETGRKLD